ncbi:MAG: DUF899 family protein [Caldilineae bacterium]|nr:DUF899 family protein [Chloroflexota bacterium]MCB9175575.1 DUF899 family protein [Caldilineae bacterium]
MDAGPAGRDDLEAEIGEKMQAWMALQGDIAGLRARWRKLWTADDASIVADYAFETPDGPVRLSQLFGDRDDLIVVHNMGRGCGYCTLWADGFIGLLPHLESRAAFVISSPDDPSTQAAFAAERGWPFRMIALGESHFAQDMGFADDAGSYMPGYSTFHRGEDGQIRRVSKDFFGPGDPYCGVWHFFDQLAEGPAGWYPRFAYGDDGA